MTTYTTKKMAELAGRLAERDAHEQRLAHALEHAGAARVALIEDLLERLGIEPEPMQPQRNKRTGEVLLDRSTGKPRMADPDADEKTRMQRLSDALDEVFRRAESASVTVATTASHVDDEQDEAGYSELLKAG